MIKPAIKMGKNWIKGEKVRAEGGERRKYLCTRRKPVIIRGKTGYKGKKLEQRVGEN
jgi:hypothetical protein